MTPADRRGPAPDPGAEVLAAGAVLWRAGPDGPQVALVHRPRYDDWSIPKGKLDADETLPVAAVREVVEETGHRIRLGARLGDVRYTVPEGPKLVRYWAGESIGGAGFAANHETDELRFLDPAAAAELVTYQRDREILEAFARIPRPTSTLLLVRHARAGSRSAWTGADADRPLSRTGRAEAARLTTFLALFGPQRVHSATPLRCRKTVEPLAERAGLTVADEPLLSEAAYRADPGATLARLRELAAQPGITVVCSQGGVIPDGVAALLAGTTFAGTAFQARADQGGDGPPEIPARKASTWVIGSRAGHPVFADYYRDTDG